MQVYYIAKKCSQRCTPEEYAVALARHFVETYPKVLTTSTQICGLLLHLLQQTLSVR